jgi:predicted TIM-barrel fold metal-dependent hydrolase
MRLTWAVVVLALAGVTIANRLGLLPNDRGKVLFGTDYPFANPRVIAEMVKTHESGFHPDARRAAIDRTNALALFPKYA